MALARLNRTVFRLSGDGVQAWLDGLVTNNLTAPISFAALLTPQGKIIADFFVVKDDKDILLDTASKFADPLHKRLKMYKLRAPIDITETELKVYALWDADDMDGQPDPRHASLGHRLITDQSLGEASDNQDAYNAHRLSLGVADSEWDFETQTTFPADANMDLMQGVDFQKGCFVGQEVVSRMKRMTNVKKRMRGLILEGPAKSGDPIKCGERTVGEVLSAHGSMGMGLVRLNRWKEADTEPTINGAAVQIMGGVDGSE